MYIACFNIAIFFNTGHVFAPFVIDQDQTQ